MKRNYKGVINRMKEVALANPLINSADDGRELELDTRKNNIWPRFFIKTTTAPITGGLGSVEMAVNFSVLLVDRIKTDRSNILDVMNDQQISLSSVLATLNKEGIIRVEDSFVLTPIYDYNDAQVAGWSVDLTAYLEEGFTCYPV